MTGGSRLALAAAYAAICVIWGSTYLAIKVGLESFDPLFYAGTRYALATLLSFALARLQGVRFTGPLRRWLPAFGVGVLFIAICNGLVFWAETRLDSGFTALLLTTSPVGTALLAPLAGERTPRAIGWLGVALGFAGTVVLIEPWRAGAVPLLPAAAVEVSVVVWAAGALWARRIREDFHPMAITVAQMGSGAVLLLTLSAVRGEALVGPVSTRALLALAYLVVFGSSVAFATYFYLLRHWEATRVATSTYVNPVVALVLGVVFLGETVTWGMVAGTAVVLAGVALVLHEQRRPDKT
ncbi:MAG TPA: EamA family transporter [Thermoanaerobaculaceae bacterium]|nr:EamA family transporter [Thermoanaerobaculaceae bacterium]